MRKQNEISHDMELVIDGMGIVLYSDGAVDDIEEGEDYYHKEFSSPEQVANHIKKGDIIGFNTGSSGCYCLKFRSGYPSEELDGNIQFRLGWRLLFREASYLSLICFG